MTARSTVVGAPRLRRFALVGASLAVALAVVSGAVLPLFPASFGSSAGLTAGASGSTRPGAAPSVLTRSPELVRGPGSAPALAVMAVSPAAPEIDPGQSVALTGNATGGTPPYTYQWYRGDYQPCAGTVAENNLAGSGAKLNVSSSYGSAYYCYTATDSESPPVTVMPSAAALVTVEPRLGAGAVTPASLTIDNGTTVLLVAHPSGGTGSYTDSWTSTTTGSPFCTIKALGTGPTWSAKPTVNTSYCYTVSDSSVGSPAAINTSLPVTLTVDPTLVTGKVSPNAPVVDSGQSLLLSAAPSGGTGPGTYAVQWYAGSGGTCSSSLKAIGTNSTTALVTVNATTSYCYSVSDASYQGPTEFSAMDTVTADSKLAAGAVTPASPSIDVGQTIILKAPATSTGTPPYTYQWYYGFYATCSAKTATPIVGQTNQSFNDTPGTNEYICYSVTDHASSPATSFSPGDLVAVNPNLGAGPVTPVSPTIDQGSSVRLTANPTGGTTPYTRYQWYSGTNSTCAGDTAIGGANAATYLASPRADTYYCYSASDSSLGTPMPSVTSGTDEVVVNLALGAGPITPAGPTIDKGQSVLLTSAAYNGTPVYTYQWYSGTLAACTTVIPGANQSTYSAQPTSNTSYCYSVSDGSANPPTRSSTVDTVTVAPPLVPGSVSPGAPGIDLGQSISLNATASGGKAPYIYQWYSGTSSTCADDTTLLGTTAAQVVKPSVNTYYCYSVTDHAYSPVQVVAAATLVTVNRDLSAGAVTAPGSVIDLTQATVLTANPSLGTPKYTFQWYEGTSANCSNDSKVKSATAPKFAVTPADTGVAYYCYVVGDASSPGYPAASATSPTFELTVNAQLKAGPVLPTNRTIDQGAYVVLFEVATGGTPPLTYQWYSTTLSTCGGANSTKIPGATSFTYNASPSSGLNYCVVISDASTGSPPGVVVSPEAVITVNIPPGPSFLGFPVVEGIIILAVPLALCALIGFLVYRRLKHGRKRGPATDFL